MTSFRILIFTLESKMDRSEVSQWLSNISCGLNLGDLATDLEERGFLIKESLKYIDGSDLDVFFHLRESCRTPKRKLVR